MFNFNRNTMMWLRLAGLIVALAALAAGGGASVPDGPP